MVERPNAKITPEPPIEPLKLKIVVVGEPGAGKTCLCKQFVYGTYNS